MIRYLLSADDTASSAAEQGRKNTHSAIAKREAGVLTKG
jgi:hypothetical protein